VADTRGEILTVIGSGRPGFQAGSFEEAKFSEPLGLAIKEEELFIADRAGHVIWKADLKTREVELFAGIGTRDPNRDPQGQALSVGLNSPWDLAIHDHVLYVAMTGSHQIWGIDLVTRQVKACVGSGLEDRVDSSWEQSALAEPAGITVFEDALYWVDSESSSLRRASIFPQARVETLVGEGLFEYGDVDGPSKTARLQHPMGIGSLGRDIILADTFNNKIKRVDAQAGIVKTLAGTGRSGREDGPFAKAAFNEPSDVCPMGGKLYVADTHNHLIRILDMESGNVSTLPLRSTPGPGAGSRSSVGAVKKK